MLNHKILAKYLWGKTDPYESLLDHMKKVGLAAEKLLTDSLYEGLLDDLCRWSGLDRNTVLKFVKYVAAMHDIGKANPAFQVKNGNPLPEGYVEQMLPRDFRHEKAVPCMASILWPTWSRKTKRAISAVIRLHHQGKIGPGNLPLNTNWEDIWRDIESEIREWSGLKDDIAVENFPDIDAFCTVLSGLIILSDWIASSGDMEAAFSALELSPAESLEPFDFKERFGFDPRLLQAETIEHIKCSGRVPLVALVEAPPGEGKTELAVWLAHIMGRYWNKKGIYFALPTAATSNQMVSRMRSFFGNKVSLIHGTAWLKEDPTGVDETWKSAQKRGLLARYAVGTVDQLMMSVLKVRFGILRLFGITNKVIIIDEIHSYDAYMTKIITTLLAWCKRLRVPVIILSATLPSERKKTLFSLDEQQSGYPLITEMFEDGKVQQFGISDVHKHSNVRIETVCGFDNVALPNEGVGCIMANTVTRAQEIYEQIRGPKILIHGRYTEAIKEDLENRVLSICGPGGSREHITIVSTQILEQSLNIDFDWLITELAPIDLLIQRIGRLHRFDIPGRGPAKCVIFVDKGVAGKEFGRSEYVYYKMLLERTKSVLSDRAEISLPDDIRPLIESVYSDFADSDDLEAFLMYSADKQIQEAEAMTNTISLPSERSFGFATEQVFADDDELSAKTRLGDGYKLCILPERLYNDVASRLNAGKAVPAQLAAEISKYSVPVVKEFDGLAGTGKLAGYILRRGTAETPLETSVSQGNEYRQSLIMDKEKGLCSM